MTVAEVQAAEPMMVPRRSSAEFPGLIGRQEPEWRLSSEPYSEIHGAHTIELFEWADPEGRLYPWQVDEIAGMSATTEDGRWVHKSATLICPRQNGKSLIAEAIMLYRLFVLRHQIVFTAQRWPTAQDIRNRLWSRIRGNPRLRAQVTRNVNSQGSATIELNDGAKVGFGTRSADTGRGFTKIDLVIFDEAYNLDPAETDALLPIQMKAADSQTIYLSTPVNAASQTFGEKLSSLRRRARKDAPSSWWWSEYSASEGMDRAKKETWAAANPSMRDGHEVDEFIKLLNDLSEESFDVEILGIGNWFGGDDDHDTVVDLDHWDSLADTTVVPAGSSCVAVECEPARSNDTGRVWSIAAAVDTESGTHLQLGFHEPASPREVAQRIRSIVDANDPVAVVMDSKSVARDLLYDQLVALGVEPELVTAGVVSKTTNNFLQSIDDATITHDGDQRIRGALETARLRDIGDAGGAGWKRRGGGQVAQLIALSYALWGLHEFRPVSRPKLRRTVLRSVSAVAADAPMTSAGSHVNSWDVVPR